MPTAQETLEFKVTNFNIIVAFLGAFISLLGLVSFLIKERLYLSEPLISLLTGLTFSPHAANLIRPLDYAQGSELNVDAITLYFTHLVLGVQLVLAGIQLPSKYVKANWKGLSMMLGPIMCAMWMSTSMIVWAMVPNISFLQALAVGSCVTPTDPVLSNNIVKGRFADNNIPKALQNLVISESGANDGLGYPFLFLALYLIQYTHDGGYSGSLGNTGGAGKAMGYWFGITWFYVIIMSTLYGVVVGWLFKEMLHWAEKHKYVDRESFLVFAVTIALFIVGTLGMLGSDDILACFVAGNTFNWDDWFRQETEDDSFQPTIDMLLNVSIFLWYGAVCPWYEFAHNDAIPIYRLIFLGILVLLLRRLPYILLIHKHMRHIHSWSHALFVGFFGPIGVSAIFYLYTALEFLRSIEVDGQQRPDAVKLSEVFRIVVWFMAVCSIIVHGLSVPLGKLGVRMPRALSRALSSDPGSQNGDQPAFQVRPPTGEKDEPKLPSVARHRGKTKSKKSSVDSTTTDSNQLPRPIFRIGGTVMHDSQAPADTHSSPETANGPLDASKLGVPGNNASDQSRPQTPSERRSIRFGDEDNKSTRSAMSSNTIGDGSHRSHVT
ncbi:MAG: hypothetical protein M1828_002399 [Chrysothrix sp. TS-e1954]|nr:MAG: hypothetical protein M1828_002399 [Chrysothrix sp. TS-e1954]